MKRRLQPSQVPQTSRTNAPNASNHQRRVAHGVFPIRVLTTTSPTIVLICGYFSELPVITGAIEGGSPNSRAALGSLQQWYSDGLIWLELCLAKRTTH